jgi:hypothetical protein
MVIGAGAAAPPPYDNPPISQDPQTVESQVLSPKGKARPPVQTSTGFLEPIFSRDRLSQSNEN